MRIHKLSLVAIGTTIAACAAGLIAAETGTFEQASSQQIKALKIDASGAAERIAADAAQLKEDASSDDQDSEEGAEFVAGPQHPGGGGRHPGPHPPPPGPRPPRPNPRPPRPGPHPRPNPRPPKPGRHPHPNPGPHPIPHPGHRPDDWNRWPGHRGWVYRGPWVWYDYPWGWGWRWWRWAVWPGEPACSIYYGNLKIACDQDCSDEYSSCAQACNGAGDCIDQCGQNSVSCNYGCQDDYEENMRDVCGIIVP